MIPKAPGGAVAPLHELARVVACVETDGEPARRGAARTCAAVPGVTGAVSALSLGARYMVIHGSSGEINAPLESLVGAGRSGLQICIRLRSGSRVSRAWLVDGLPAPLGASAKSFQVA